MYQLFSGEQQTWVSSGFLDLASRDTDFWIHLPAHAVVGRHPGQTGWPLTGAVGPTARGGNGSPSNPAVPGRAAAAPGLPGAARMQIVGNVPGDRGGQPS
jgi:hypothetical protein